VPGNSNASGGGDVDGFTPGCPLPSLGLALMTISLGDTNLEMSVTKKGQRYLVLSVMGKHLDWFHTGTCWRVKWSEFTVRLSFQVYAAVQDSWVAEAAGSSLPLSGRNVVTVVHVDTVYFDPLPPFGRDDAEAPNVVDIVDEVKLELLVRERPGREALPARFCLLGGDRFIHGANLFKLGTLVAHIFFPHPLFLYNFSIV